MKKQVEAIEPEESEVLDKEFVTKISKEIYHQFLQNKIDLDVEEGINNAMIELVDDNEEVGIQLSFMIDKEDGSFAIIINPDEIFIDEYEGNAYGWQDFTDSYDTFSIKEQIENEVNKLLGTKHSHKKNKEVIKHMKNDMD